MRLHFALALAAGSLALMTASDDVLAQAPAAALSDVRISSAREGGTSDRFHSNQQLKLAIAGQGTCDLDIEVHERGRGRLVSTRRVRAQLPLRYVSDHALPALGRPGEARSLVIKVVPRPVSARGGGGCRGRTFIQEITVVNRGAPASREPSTPVAAAPAGGGAGGESPSTPPPSAGALATLQVPGGSMQEGAGQQLQLDGSGTCTFDLRIQRTDGTPFDQTFPVQPARPLPTTAVNGLEFPMLAQGSYMATATGKGGCTGAPTINFKVLPQPVVQKDPNAPSFKKPTNGQVRKPTDPDGTNVYFELDVPSAIKSSDMSTGCCEVEFNYKDPTGQWTPLVETGPTQYPELKTTAMFRSISYFDKSLSWRVRARGYKFQTEFPWSEWVEFTVYQK